MQFYRRVFNDILLKNMSHNYSKRQWFNFNYQNLIKFKGIGSNDFKWIEVIFQQTQEEETRSKKKSDPHLNTIDYMNRVKLNARQKFIFQSRYKIGKVFI